MINFIDSVSFQFFPAKIWEAQPLGELTLRQFLEVHKTPKQSTVDVIEQIKIAAKNGDLKLKDSFIIITKFIFLILHLTYEFNRFFVFGFCYRLCRDYASRIDQYDGRKSES